VRKRDGVHQRRSELGTIRVVYDKQARGLILDDMTNHSLAGPNTTSDGRISEPTALILSGGALLLIGVAVGSVADGGLGVILAAVSSFVGTTLWLIGVIATGIRIGRSH
jgi:hypothetical protein